MIPLALVGATTVAKYLVDRANPHAVPILPAGNPIADFGSVLMSAVGAREGSASLESESRALSRKLMERSEIQSALSVMPTGAELALQVQSDGGLRLSGAGGTINLTVTEETRTLARQVFVANATSAGAPSILTPDGVSAISLPLRVAKGV